MSLDLLRFTTAGSVDDGKSTLIGRLLYDSKQVFEDQLEHVREASRRRGGDGALDLSLLVDGLRAEREQGITIDVAYRYFATAKRRFIIADTPGHVQYTRNMVTGASTADLAVILLDARSGVVADPPPRPDRLPARHPPHRRGRQQDGPGRLQPTAVWGDQGGVRAVRPRPPGGCPAPLHPPLRPPRRQRGGALHPDGVVRRPHPAGAAGDRRGRLRPPGGGGRPLPRPVGDQAGAPAKRQAPPPSSPPCRPRLPRLRRPACLREVEGWRAGGCPAGGGAHRDRRNRHLRRSLERGGGADVGGAAPCRRGGRLTRRPDLPAGRGAAAAAGGGCRPLLDGGPAAAGRQPLPAAPHHAGGPRDRPGGGRPA